MTYHIDDTAELDYRTMKTTSLRLHLVMRSTLVLHNQVPGDMCIPEQPGLGDDDDAPQQGLVELGPAAGQVVVGLKPSQLLQLADTKEHIQLPFHHIQSLLRGSLHSHRQELQIQINPPHHLSPQLYRSPSIQEDLEG